MPRSIYFRCGRRGISGPKITSINGGAAVPPDGEDIVCTGINFGSSQGTGKLELANAANYDEATTIVEQTIVSWSDTEIVFDVVPGGLF